jgi:hypothetical protein
VKTNIGAYMEDEASSISNEVKVEGHLDVKIVNEELRWALELRSFSLGLYPKPIPACHRVKCHVTRHVMEMPRAIVFPDRPKPFGPIASKKSTLSVR